MADWPTGTVTFLFTDVEGSTRLWEERPDAMPAAVAAHLALLRRTVEAHGGRVFRTQGDGLCAVFAVAPAAVAAALAAQRALRAASSDAPTLRARGAAHGRRGRAGRRLRRRVPQPDR